MRCKGRDRVGQVEKGLVARSWALGPPAVTQSHWISSQHREMAPAVSEMLQASWQGAGGEAVVGVLTRCPGVLLRLTLPKRWCPVPGPSMMPSSGGDSRLRVDTSRHL